MISTRFKGKKKLWSTTWVRWNPNNKQVGRGWDNTNNRKVYIRRKSNFGGYIIIWFSTHTVNNGVADFPNQICAYSGKTATTTKDNTSNQSARSPLCPHPTINPNKSTSRICAIGLTDRYMGGYPILIPMFGSEVTILGLAPGYRNRTGRSHTERWYVRVVDGHIGKSTSVGRSEDDVTTEW